MANWCYNYLNITCNNPSEREAVIELLNLIVVHELKQSGLPPQRQEGWMHPVLLQEQKDDDSLNYGYIHDFEIDDIPKNESWPSVFTCRFQTRWGAEKSTIKRLANLPMVKGTKWELEWDECGMEQYGKMSVCGDEVLIAELDQEDLGKLQQDEDGIEFRVLENGETLWGAEAVDSLLDDKWDNLTKSKS